MKRNRVQRILGIIVATFLLTTLLSLTATAATYYIDFDNGNDYNNGLATSTAWKRAPGDAQATGAALNTMLVAGDTLRFKGGVVYRGKVNINWSGTSGNVITYDGNSAGTWGTGKAIIDGEHIDSADRKYGFNADASISHVTIRNFEIRNMGGGVTPTSCSTTTTNAGYGIWFGRGGTHIIVRDCKIWNIGVWENVPFQRLANMSGRGIYFRGSSSNILVENNELTKMGDVVIGFAPWVQYGNEVTNIRIKDNRLYGFTRWGIYLGLAISNAIVNDVRIQGNSVYNNTYHTPWQGCSGEYPHYDGLILTTNTSGGTGTLGTPEKPVRIYDNKFYYDTEATAGGGTAEMFLTAWGGSTYIYNNTFKRVLSSGGSILFQGMSSGHPADFRVYNNSFYGASHGVRVRDLGGVSFLGATALEVSNNAFHHTNTGTMTPISGIGVPISHFTRIENNIFYTARSNKQVAMHYPSGALSGLTVDQINAMSNASGNILADSPFFADLSYGYGLFSSLNDLRLSEGSVGVNAGLDLSAYFTTDHSGNNRPAGWNAWSIGAYQGSTTGGSVTYALAVSKSGSGTVTGGNLNCGTTCNYRYTSGTQVSLSAAPATGYTFAGWSGSGCTGTGTCLVTMNADKSVTATFTEAPVSNNTILTTMKDGTGSGVVVSTNAGINCGTTCSAQYSNNESVTLNATPDSSSTFAGWSGACSGLGSCYLTMSGSKNVTATFTAIPANGKKSLTVVKNGNGNYNNGNKVRSIAALAPQSAQLAVNDPEVIDCGDVCSAEYDEGTVVTLMAEVTDSSYSFAGWSGACSGTGGCVVTVDDATSVTATFTSASSSGTPGVGFSADGGGGGCFIATAAFGSYLDPQVMVLRNFRDNVLLQNGLGKQFVNLYYKHSPQVADTIAQSELLRTITRLALTPFIYAVAYPNVAAMISLSVLLMTLMIVRRRRMDKTAHGYAISGRYFEHGPRSGFLRVR